MMNKKIKLLNKDRIIITDCNFASNIASCSSVTDPLFI